MTSDVLVTGDATLDWHVLRAGAGASSQDAAAHGRALRLRSLLQQHLVGQIPRILGGAGCTIARAAE